jgi:hypothetical protein
VSVSVFTGTSSRPSRVADVFRYLVIPGFYDAEETGEMTGRAKELLDAFDPSGHPLVSTRHSPR